MPTYIKTEWVDGENKYSITDQLGNVISGFEDIKLLYTGTGGTPVSATNQNHIEQGIEDAQDTADQHISDIDNPHGVNTKDIIHYPGDAVIASAAGTPISIINESAMMKIYEFTLNITGNLRISFSMRSAHIEFWTRAQIYKNDVPYGIVRQNQSTTAILYVEDLAIVPDDKIQIYGMIEYNPQYGWVDLFSISHLGEVGV